MKAKKKKKYVVSYGVYIGSEHKDALSCGAFRELYDSMRDAHDAIMQDIRQIVVEYLDDLSAQCDEKFPDDEADKRIADCVWRNEADSVRFEHGDTEYAFEIEEITV